MWNCFKNYPFSSKLNQSSGSFQIGNKMIHFIGDFSIKIQMQEAALSKSHDWDWKQINTERDRTPKLAFLNTISPESTEYLSASDPSETWSALIHLLDHQILLE